VDCEVEVDYLKGKEYLDGGDALSRPCQYQLTDTCIITHIPSTLPSTIHS